MPSLHQTPQSTVRGVLLLYFITEYLSQVTGTSQPRLTFLEGTWWDNASPLLSFMGTKGRIQMAIPPHIGCLGACVSFLRCQSTHHTSLWGE